VARLPIPGSDSETWGEILNDYLSVSHNSDGTLQPAAVTDSGAIASSTVTAKGDLVVGTGSAALSRLQKGTDGQVLVTDSAQTTGLAWNNPAEGPAYPLAGYGLVAATDNPGSFNGTGSIGTGYVWLTRMWVPPNTSFNKIALVVTTSSTYTPSAVPNQMGWYTDDGVLQDVTADDSAMWSTSNSWYVGTLSTPVPAQSSGRFIYVATITGGFSGVSHFYLTGANYIVLTSIVGSAKRRCMYANGQTSLPTSFDPTSYGTPTAYIPLMGLQ
jgi:hypothetical protein